MSDRSQPVSDDGCVGRSARTQTNNVESCAMRVPAAFLSLALYQSSSATGVTAGVYAAIRTYWLKFNLLRSLSWLVGMICTAVMAALALQAAAFPPSLSSNVGALAMPKSDQATLFASFALGELQLRNRVVMASMTRGRARNAELTPTELQVEYYRQRASAGLILMESTWVSSRASLLRQAVH